MKNISRNRSKKQIAARANAVPIVIPSMNLMISHKPTESLAAMVFERGVINGLLEEARTDTGS